MCANSPVSEINWPAVAACLAARPWVVAAWVFGSAQGGTIRPGGDLDIGVLADRRPSLAELAALRAALQAAAGVEAIDLVLLRDATVVTRFAAVSGRSLYTRDPAARAAFVSLTAREYEDEMAQLARALANRADMTKEAPH